MSAAPLKLVPKPSAPVPSWREYPRVTPGNYLGYCRRARIYRDRGYSRWTSLLTFDLIAQSGENIAVGVPMWFALGSGQRPHASRTSKYWKAWLSANAAGPKRGDRMTPGVFVHRMARVRVDDTQGLARYSKIVAIRSWETVAKAPSYPSASLTADYMTDDSAKHRGKP